MWHGTKIALKNVTATLEMWFIRTISCVYRKTEINLM